MSEPTTGAPRSHGDETTSAWQDDDSRWIDGDLESGADPVEDPVETPTPTDDVTG